MIQGQTILRVHSRVWSSIRWQGGRAALTGIKKRRRYSINSRARANSAGVFKLVKDKPPAS